MTESADAEANEVCIVDDDPSVLKSMYYLLASEGFKVRSFDKAEDFLVHAGAHHVPVVVTDIWMDHVTGLELSSQRKNCFASAKVPRPGASNTSGDSIPAQ